MKKVLIVANTLGFITKFLSGDIDILVNKGYLVECACNTQYEDNNTHDFKKKFPQIRVYDIPFPIRELEPKQLREAYSGTCNLIKETKYALVHVHTTIAAAIVRHYSKYLHKSGSKIVYTAHGFPFYKGNTSKSAMFFYQVEKYYSRYTDALIAINNEDYEIARQFHCKKYRIHGVGVDIDKYNLYNFNKLEYMKILGIPEDTIVVLSVGELNSNKNHQLIIRALSEVQGEFLYVICGREVTDIGKQKELQDLADLCNVKVMFLGYRKDIPEICNCADFGAIPSYKEGLNVSGLEMLASGLPIIASDIRGLNDYVIEGKTGFLFDPHSVESCITATKRMVDVYSSNNLKVQCVSAAEKYKKQNVRLEMDKIYSDLNI